MTKLFVLADDLTGALDTAVQFAAQGISTCVVTNEKFDFSREAADVSILVMSIPTRHMSAQSAYLAVLAATRQAVAAGIPYLYKKIDSVLRGNVGAELTAMMDAAGADRLDFLPAFPALKRTTVNGVQLLDGRPIHESIFKDDPFEPVTDSYIPDIIAKQSRVACQVVRAGDIAPDADERRVFIYDAKTDADLRDAAERIHRERVLRVMAGCAGFAGVLAGALGLAGGRTLPCAPQSRLFVVCGSMNPITRAQLDYAQRNGFERITLTSEQRLERAAITDELIERIMARYRTGKPLILDVNDSASTPCEDVLGVAHSRREHIAENLAYIVERLWNGGLRATLMATGGDTLLAVLAAMGLNAIRPIREMQPGVVLSECMCGEQLVPIISKAGGFGGEKLLTEIADELSKANGGIL